MASFLGSIKKGLGLSKSNDTKGQVLGGNPTSDAGSNCSNFQHYNVEFTDHKLGMGIAEVSISSVRRPVVTEVVEKSEAHRKGVRVGDEIIALENNEIHNFESFSESISALGRPITLRYYHCILNL